MLKKFFPGGEVKAITNRTGKISTGVTLNGIPGVFSIYGHSCLTNNGQSTPCVAVQYWIPNSFSENDAYNQCVAVISKNFGDSVLSKQANGRGDSVSGSSTDIQRISSICQNAVGVTLFLR